MIFKNLVDEFCSSGEFAQLIPYMEKGEPLSIEGIPSSSFALIIASIYRTSGSQMLVVTENSTTLEELQQDLACFVDDQDIIALPGWDTLPYEDVSPPERIQRQRLTSIYRLIAGDNGIVIATVESLIRLIPEKNFFTNRGLTLKMGEEIPFDDLIETIAEYGFSREHKVEEYGQFSVKGGIVDVFLPSRDRPVRLDFFGDTVESIREFDPVSQISGDSLSSVTFYPRHEISLLPSEKETIARWIKTSGSAEKIAAAESFITGTIEHLPGIEDIFPLAVEPAPVHTLLKNDAYIILTDPAGLNTKRNQIEKTYTELFSRKHESDSCLPPEKLIDGSILDSISLNALRLQTMTTNPGALHWGFKGLQNYHGKVPAVRDEISKRIDEGWKAVVSTAFEGQARRLADMFAKLNPEPGFSSLPESFKLGIVISGFRNGIEMASTRTVIFTDNDIFGRSYRKKASFKKKASRPIESFLDLKEGDYIVHINHGIGIFSGIERMAAGGVERDFLLINYADGDRLFVSLDQITMVQKYIGMEGRPPRIDALGKKSAWNKIKERVKESVEIIAKELIEIYSMRSALRGYQYPPDTLWQEEFEARFEYDETPDQITAIEDVKDDMESPKPMDRLICGDVGFGKTEVAIRAAFKAVMAGRQVALLVPTTVLAMQHFTTFKKRFAEYPFEIEMISRFRTASQIRQIKEKLAEGKVDIVVGTHAILSKDMNIKNLGLLIIDEEQKFGVRHKEHLKKLRAMVDVLTLSATPIPRTLHMSMAGIRDLSTISTPPENRQSIETYVLEDNPDILALAIRTEIERNGQVFFVHNRVNDIDEYASMIRTLVPEASVCVAHGQMHEHELEEIMIDFMNRKYDVLVSTTIIESGLDIPNVNTIIINRADTLGLSQLYQLKGRVGRSSRKSFAYLFHPRHIALTEDAQKRLQVISEFSELGSGLKVAMRDLEIRGAGNILGKEQSGDIMEVGFDLYCQMLEDSVKRLKGEKPVFAHRTNLFIRMDFFIPEDYISDERQKIEFYKRFESCSTSEEVDMLEKELKDRFGAPHGQVLNLIEFERIRAAASVLFIDEIIEDSRSIRIRISSHAKINSSKLIEIISKDSRFSPDMSDSTILHFRPGTDETQKKLIELKKWLQQIS